MLAGRLGLLSSIWVELICLLLLCCSCQIVRVAITTASHTLSMGDIAFMTQDTCHTCHSNYTTPYYTYSTDKENSILLLLYLFWKEASTQGINRQTNSSKEVMMIQSGCPHPTVTVLCSLCHRQIEKTVGCWHLLGSSALVELSWVVVLLFCCGCGCRSIGSIGVQEHRHSFCADAATQTDRQERYIQCVDMTSSCWRYAVRCAVCLFLCHRQYTQTENRSRMLCDRLGRLLILVWCDVMWFELSSSYYVVVGCRSILFFDRSVWWNQHTVLCVSGLVCVCVFDESIMQIVYQDSCSLFLLLW